MTWKNGQTQETSRRLNSSNISDKPEGLGGLQGTSSVDGIKQIGLNPVDCPAENNFRGASKHGNHFVGKILERLKRLEEKYFSRLKAHQNVLKTHLNQAEQDEESFRQEIQQIEEEIYNLFSSEGKSQPSSEESQQ